MNDSDTQELAAGSVRTQSRGLVPSTAAGTRELLGHLFPGSPRDGSVLSPRRASALRPVSTLESQTWQGLGAHFATRSLPLSSAAGLVNGDAAAAGAEVERSALFVARTQPRTTWRGFGEKVEWGQGGSWARQPWCLHTQPPLSSLSSF